MAAVGAMAAAARQALACVAAKVVGRTMLTVGMGAGTAAPERSCRRRCSCHRLHPSLAWARQVVVCAVAKAVATAIHRRHPLQAEARWPEREGTAVVTVVADWQPPRAALGKAATAVRAETRDHLRRY
jgi:hypothetical protein